MVITSRQNAKIKKIASLKDKKYRSEYGLYVVEGKKMVKEAIENGVQIECIVGLPSVISQLPVTTAEIVETDENVFSSLTDTKTPQGVLAVVKTPENIAVKPSGNCAILDGVSDPGNLGTIIRTCAAIGIKDVYLCGCADAFSPKTIRSCMSGIFFVNIHSFDKEVVSSLVEDTQLLVADMNGENVLGFSCDRNYALVVGNEANGVSDFFKERADKTLRIPMQATVESLNVAVSFAVCAYALSGKTI